MKYTITITNILNLFLFEGIKKQWPVLIFRKLTQFKRAVLQIEALHLLIFQRPKLTSYLGNHLLNFHKVLKDHNVFTRIISPENCSSV